MDFLHPVLEFLAVVVFCQACFFQKSRMAYRLSVLSFLFLLLYYISVLFWSQEEVFILANHKHLLLDERIIIEKELEQHASFKTIAAELGKDCTTISKEVRNHRTFKKSGAFGKAFNNCAKRYQCDHRHLCTGCKNSRFCWSCRKCTSVCPDFQEQKCPLLSKAPYVCNGCGSLKQCTLEKCFYKAAYSDTEYRATLREARQGISLSESEVRHLDSVISPLILKGQSINHIFANNRDSIMVSESTVYRLIDYNAFTARNIDLPRKVRYAKRKEKKQIKVDPQCRLGRTYEDFKDFMAGHPDFPVTEIDSVEGKKGGKVLLTIHFVKAEFMLAFLRDSNDSQSVIDVFNRLYIELRCDIFMEIMPVLLGDNGSEFSNPKALEYDQQGNLRTRVFYCDPAAPEQKGSAERNHEMIRYFVPKGNTLDCYTQDDICLMMDNINSYCRKSLGNKTPYDMMAFLYGEKTLEMLGSHKIPANEVTLNASIFKNRESGTNEKSN